MGKLLLAALLVLSIPAPADAAEGLVPGEAFTFRLSIGPIVGARARMAVGLPVLKGGRPLVAVQGEAETLSLAKLLAPLEASYVLTLDAHTLLPLEIVSNEKGMSDVSFHSHLTGRGLDLEVVGGRRPGRSQRVLAREPRDPLSAYFALRTMPLDGAHPIVVDVLDGGALWHLRLSVVGREEIRLGEDTERPGPPLQAIHLEGKLDRIADSGRSMGRPPRTISLWLSDDEVRVLYRCKFDSDIGRAQLELTSYVPPSKGPAGAREAVDSGGTDGAGLAAPASQWSDGAGVGTRGRPCNNCLSTRGRVL